MKLVVNIYEKWIWLVTFLVIAVAAAITLPKFAGIQPYIILSSSMEPAIPTGSLVFVNTRARQMHEGDIITFTMLNGNEEITVTHRIMKITDAGFVTKGDNNEVEDLSLLTADRIVGKCEASIPYAGYAMSKLTPNIMMAAAAWLLGLHAFGFVFDSIVNDGGDSRSNKPEIPRGFKIKNIISFKKAERSDRSDIRDLICRKK